MVLLSFYTHDLDLDLADKMSDTKSVTEGWEKWQIALAVGAPIALGLAGLWYYNRSKYPKNSSKGGEKGDAEDVNTANESTIRPSTSQTTESEVYSHSFFV